MTKFQRCFSFCVASLSERPGRIRSLALLFMSGGIEGYVSSSDSATVEPFTMRLASACRERTSWRNTDFVEVIEGCTGTIVRGTRSVVIGVPVLHRWIQSRQSHRGFCTLFD